MYLIIIFLSCFLSISSTKIDKNITTVNKRALQKEHELAQPEKWANTFFGKTNDKNLQSNSLVDLLSIVALHMNNCTVIVLYDSSAEDIDKVILEKLFKQLPLAYVHGKIGDNFTIAQKLRESTKDKCIAYMLFLKDVLKVTNVIGKQRFSKVAIISKSSQWRIHEFLRSEVAKDFVNLLVICKSEQIRTDDTEIPYILYTHKMYIDGLGSSMPQILMSWYKNKLTKPQDSLFPRKMAQGFAGHRFIISVADQPPFVIKRINKNSELIEWDGLEIRLIHFLSGILNFTTEFQEPKFVDTIGSGDAVARILQNKEADIGLAGLYITKERTDTFELTHGHSYDCAAFISLTSTALPRYRAIMGPFHWTVWLALTMIYLLAIFPIAFSDRLTLTHLIHRPQEMENMFWYVFGTFTNCFTFNGKDSWNNTKKTSTRMFIGWYWVFTIIISACYTGSIIAFVTLPVFPNTIDSVQQLLSGHFQIGTLDKGGWQYWYNNVTDKKSKKLMKNIEYLPDIASGLKNISKAFFWPYAFLGSKEELDYIVRTNFTTSNKRSILHISRECFAPYSVSIGFPKDSVYKNSINIAVLRIVQSGLMIKMKNDVDWDIMRSATGKLLQANSVGKIKNPSAEDRALSLQDTQGMFLLLSAGFLIGGASLISEWFGGCFKFCRTGKINRNNSAACQRKSIHTVPTPNDGTTVDVDVSRRNSSNNVIVHAFPESDMDYQEIANGDSLRNENISSDINEKVDAVESPALSENSSDSDYDINIFNFDHLFGEDNDITEDEHISQHSDNLLEYIN